MSKTSKPVQESSLHSIFALKISQNSPLFFRNFWHKSTANKTFCGLYFMSSSRYNRFEPLVIMRVDKSGAFYDAGFKFGDVLLDSNHRWVHQVIGSYDQPSGTTIYIQSIPDGINAKNWEELSKMQLVTRQVIAP